MLNRMDAEIDILTIFPLLIVIASVILAIFIFVEDFFSKNKDK